MPEPSATLPITLPLFSLSCTAAALVLLIGLSALAVFGSSPAGAQGALPASLVNGDFEQGTPGEIPPGWIVTTRATIGALSAENPAEGAQCAFATCDQEGKSFCNLVQQVDARPFRGQLITVSAQVRYTGEGGAAHLWVRVDRAGKLMGFFDNMNGRPIQSDQWKRYEIAGKVDDDAEVVSVGVFVRGGGTAWIDDVRLEATPWLSGADAPPGKLTRRGLINIVAFARLLGYVRHFHPSDEAVGADWPRFAMAGVERVEGASTSVELATALLELFAPLAPSVAVWVGNRAPELSVPTGATHWVSWRHAGYGQEREGRPESPYNSSLTRVALDGGGGEPGGTKPATVVPVNFGERLHARVPIGVYADARTTLPRAEGTPAAPRRPDGWRPSASDRSVRLAGVILAWNVLQHFYPYFDAVETNWIAALREALWDASDDSGDDEYQATLERLGAALHDGHTFVRGPRSAIAAPLITWEWVGEELTVTATPADSISTVIKAGDAVEAIDGRAVSEIFAEIAPRISASTEQWRRVRSLYRIGATSSAAIVQVTVRHPDGTRETAPVPTSGAGPGRSSPAVVGNGDELAPGVRYFNLVGAETDTLVALLPALAAAKGVIFDLRGYPASAGSELLQYLCSGPIQSANWNVPIITMPDMQNVTYQTSHWDIAPAEPHIGGKVVFVTDGRAISYAESCLGIVEHYKLGEIVGGATAGTNGDVISVSLPGGYSVNFTGMQVTKQDGSRHHGVGILPTVPAERTIAGIAAGRDELLETAVRVALGSPSQPERNDVAKPE